MRLSTSLFCVLLSATALAACGSEAEEEGTTARPGRDDGDAGDGGTGGTAGTGGSTSKGGSAGKGGASNAGSGGSSGKGGTSGSAGSSAGNGGSGGTSAGNGGSAGSTAGTGGTTAGSGGSTAGMSGSSGSTAGTGGSSGSTAGTGGSSGSTAGTGGSGGSSAGTGGSSGSSAGTGGSSAGASGGAGASGSAGKGGSATCTDGYTGNDSRAKAFALGDIGDNASASNVSGKVAANQTDWYVYNGKDNSNPVYKVNPNVEWTSSQEVTVCIYAKCADGSSWGDACSEGTPATIDGQNGCCAKGGGKVKLGSYSCCSGFGCSDDATVSVSVNRATGGASCTSYDLAVKYGTGSVFGPQVADAPAPDADASPAP